MKIINNFIILIFLLLLLTKIELSQTLNSDMFVTNGEVMTMFQEGNYLYIGGRFTYVGKNSGSAVLIDPISGPDYVDANFPKINGQVYTACSDGNGGWFIGGDFTYAGDSSRQDFVHILSDYSIDPNWNLTFLGSVTSVNVISIHNSKLYIGGVFDKINNIERYGLASFDLVSGLLLNWYPKPYSGSSLGGLINTLTFKDTIVFVGGVFTSLNSSSPTDNRDDLAAVGETSGILTNFNSGSFFYFDRFDQSTVLPGTFQSTHINKLKFFGDTLFVLGAFSFDGGNYGVAAIKSDTVLMWDPTITNVIYSNPIEPDFFDIQIKDNTIFLAGKFSNFLDPIVGDGNATLTRNNIMAVSKNLVISPGLSSILGIDYYVSEIYSWDPNIQGNNWDSFMTRNLKVKSLTLSNNALYVAGTFNSVGGEVHQNLVGIDIITGSVIWDANLNSADATNSECIHTLEEANGKFIAGGYLSAYGGIYCTGIAKIDITTGTVVTNWNPNLSYNVLGNFPIITSISGNENIISFSGIFSSVNGISRSGFAAVDAPTGNIISSFNFINSGITKLLCSGEILYVGGSFSSIDGGTTTRYGLASIDLNTNTITSWNPNSLPINGQITDMLIHNNTLYLSGSFTSLGAGISRSGLGAVDITDGTLMGWNPTFSSGTKVRAMTYSNNTVFITGSFTTVNSTPRKYIAGLDPISGVTTSWNFSNIFYSSNDSYAGLYDIISSPDNTVLFVGGLIDSLDGSRTQRGFAQINSIDGTLVNWNPEIDGFNPVVNSIEMDTFGNYLFIAGLFNQIGKSPRNNLVMYTFSIPLPVELTTFTANNLINGIELHWQTATEVNNYGFEILRSAQNDENWVNLGFVNGNGNSNSPKDYSFVDEDIKNQPNGKYYYRLKQIDTDGGYKYSSTIEIDWTNGVTDVNDENNLPKEFSLSQNYPNPFNPTTKIKYTIPVETQNFASQRNGVSVQLKIYNIMGQEIATLVNEVKTPGEYEVEFNSKGLSSGMYFYKIEAGSFNNVKKMILLK